METGLENVGMLELIKREFDCKENDIRTYSPLTLAYLGDAIYELVIRSVLLERGNRSNESLHKSAIKYVKAENQSKMIMALEDELTEEEMSVYKRGRNAKSYTKAKNASVTDYRKATGFEALMGYLYLAGEDKRMLDLIKLALERCELKI
ncbi:MAG: ribonuclease III domain-containing protein [Lachnospiraceae bacterium]|nr:ribonuclease III domain-containing protein [Lachnospiraceae bacterium]